MTAQKDMSASDRGVEEAPDVLPHRGLGDQLIAIARKHQIADDEVEAVQANIRSSRSPIGSSSKK